MPSYIGTSIENKPAWMKRNEKLHKAIHEKYEFTPTMEQAIALINKWLEYKHSQPCTNAEGKTIKEVLDEIKKQNNELKDDMNKKYSKYSLGMRQKLSIAQAIMEHQKVILLDEPFNGIDRQSVVAIKEYLKRVKNEDKLIIITTHIMDDVVDLSDVMLYIEDGMLNEKD